MFSYLLFCWRWGFRVVTVWRLVYLAGAAGEVSPGVPGWGPGAEAAKAWGSWEKANAAFNRYVAEGMTPAEAAREAAKGPKGGS